MRKIAKLVAVMLFVFSIMSIFSACNSNKYKLTVEDPEGYIIEKLDKRYAAGETVTVKTGIIEDAVVTVYLDGVAVDDVELIKIDGHYSHYEHYFVMPAHDAVLSVKTSDGFLEDKPTIYEQIRQEIIDAYIARYPYIALEPDYSEYNIRITHYLEFDNTYVITIDYWNPNTNNNVMHTETVDGIIFYFLGSYTYSVYREGELCSLNDAFGRGWLTHDNLLALRNKHRENYDWLYESYDNEQQMTHLGKAIEEEIINSFIVAHSDYKYPINPADISLRCYGAFDGVYAIFVDASMWEYPANTESEFIAGVQFVYGSEQTMDVYFDGELYSLTSAHNNNILSREELLIIQKNYNGNNTEEQQDYVLTISAAKQVYAKGEDILVDITLENRSGEDVEIAYSPLVIPESPTGEFPTICPPPITTKKLFKNGEIIHITENVKGDFHIGYHQLNYRAVFYLSWFMTEFGYEKTDDMIIVWSNTIKFSVIE